MTRAQLAVILNGLLGRTPSPLDDLPRGRPIFDDSRDAQAWYFLPIQEAAVWPTPPPRPGSMNAGRGWVQGCAEHRLHKDAVQRGRVVL